MLNKHDAKEVMARYVHITKDKDVMMVIPKILMMLDLSSSLGCFMTKRRQRLKFVVRVAMTGPAEPRAEEPLQTQQRGGVADLFGPGQGWSGRMQGCVDVVVQFRNFPLNLSM